ncbi:MAG: TIR domain-containing protein [bacterium]
MIIKDEQHKILETSSYDVFISHASEDSAWCEKLVERLQKYGLIVWFDEFQLRAGNSLSNAISDGLANSRRVVIVMTPDYFAKDWTQAEASFAINQDPSGRRKVVIPVLRKDCTIPPLLQSITYSDFRDEAHFEDNCRRLADILRGHYPEANFNTLNESKIAEAMPAPGFSYGSKDRLAAKANDTPEIVRRPSPALDPIELVREKLNSLVKPEEGQRWLHAPNKIFEGRRPIDLITNGEVDRIMEILVRIEEGIHN